MTKHYRHLLSQALDAVENQLVKVTTSNNDIALVVALRAIAILIEERIREDESSIRG